jgi:hypothetical protein
MHFDTLHRQAFGVSAHFSGAKDATLLASLWRERQLDPITVEMLMAEFFAHPTAWTKQNGFTVGIFYSQVGKLLLQVIQRERPVADWFEECTRLHNRTCNGRYAHSLKLEIEAARKQA